MLQRKVIIQFLFVIAIIMMLITQAPMAYSSALIRKIIITDVDYSEFPDISTKVRVLTDKRNPVTSLTKEDIKITEDDQVIEDFSLKKVNAGIKVAIVFDVGAGVYHLGATGESQFDEMKTIAKKFVDSMDTRDSAELILVRGAQTRVLEPLKNDKEELLREINNLSVGEPRTLTNGLDGIKQGLNDLKEATGTQTPLAVLFLTPGIQSKYQGERTSYDDIRNILENMDVPIHTVLVRDNDNKEDLEQLAEDSQAYFQRYTDVSVLESLFSLFEAQRWQYEISYRSSSGSAGERQLKVAANTESASPVYDVYSFVVQPEPQAPEILSLTVNNGNPVVREAESHDSDLTDIPITDAQIMVQIPEDFDRTITKAELFVDGEPHGKPLTNLESSKDIIFTWDLRTYTTVGEKTHRLEVRIKDELGFESSLGKQIIVAVRVPLAPTPRPTLISTSDPRCESLKKVPLLYDTCINSGITPGIMLTIVTIIIATASIGAVLWFRPDVRQKVGKAAKGLTDRLGITSSEPKAYLELLKGPQNIELKERYGIFGETPIGRDPGFAELIFDSTKVSRLHCALHYKGGEWSIEDKESSNGTFLNGRQLTPREPVALHDEDVIELTQVERGGIKFRFSIVEEDFSDVLAETLADGGLEEDISVPPEDVDVTKPFKPAYEDDDLHGIVGGDGYEEEFEDVDITQPFKPAYEDDLRDDAIEIESDLDDEGAGLADESEKEDEDEFDPSAQVF